MSYPCKAVRLPSMPLNLGTFIENALPDSFSDSQSNSDETVVSTISLR